MEKKKKMFDQSDIIRPGRSVFDLSYKKLLTMDMGQLIPVQHDMVFPGDVFQMSNSVMVRIQPMVAPLMHSVSVSYHSFFVALRNLDPDNWADFITGGKLGTDTYTLPRWTPTDSTAGSLWDFFGFPVGVTPTDALPLEYLLRAYNDIYNWKYRDENLIDEVDLDDEDIKIRAWRKGYFESALPWQQRGTAPALPVSGSSSAVFSGNIDVKTGSQNVTIQPDAGSPYTVKTTANPFTQTAVTALKTDLDNNTVDFSSATTFDLSDIRLAASIQLYMERNARAGVRLPEFTKAHFGVDMGDHRIDAPEYIGGTRNNITVNEVLQTSETNTTPQGTMTGHGISNRGGKVGTYRAKEHGIIMSILSIMPEAIYQQGVDRQWQPLTRYDFYTPELANLSEQAILQGEIYATGTGSENTTVFGYQGRWDEHRWKRNMVVSQMRDDFDHYHISRQFSSAPLLNQSFIECVPRKDFLAAPSEPGFLVDCGNIIRATRPMPYMARPGITRL